MHGHCTVYGPLSARRRNNACRYFSPLPSFSPLPDTPRPHNDLAHRNCAIAAAGLAARSGGGAPLRYPDTPTSPGPPTHRTCATVASGLAAHSSAAAPETTGQAMLVPLISAYELAPVPTAL